MRATVGLLLIAIALWAADAAVTALSAGEVLR